MCVWSQALAEAHFLGASISKHANGVHLLRTSRDGLKNYMNDQTTNPNTPIPRFHGWEGNIFWAVLGSPAKSLTFGG